LSSNDGKHFEKIFSEQNTGLILGKKYGRTRRKDFGGIFRFFGRQRDFRDGGRLAGGTAACAGFPAWWPTAVLGRHTTGDGPSAGGAGGIRGTRAEEKGIDRGFERGVK
jgi:hypothetical protein